MKKSYQVFGLALTGAISILIFGLWQSGKLSKILGDKKSSNIPNQAWSLALTEVHNAWSGKIDLKTFPESCSHFKAESNIPRELKSCRPDLLQCQFEGKKNLVKIRNDFYPFEVKVMKGDDSFFVLKIKKKERKYRLTNNCRQVKLPSGAYWGDNRRDKSKRIWHTSGIEYWVDRFLVRNLDLRAVILESEKGFERIKERVLSLKGKELFNPIGFLYPNEMKAYCNRLGTEVLTSQVKSALTFHHGRAALEDISKEPPGWNSAPHPFGLRREESPAYLAKNGSEFDKKFCKKIFSKECLKENYQSYFPVSLGWSGVAELLGGLPEYVVNLEFPRKNIHPSSIYYPLKSAIHEAGKRIYWSGRGFRSIDFNFSMNPTFDNNVDLYEVGFRCMTKKVKREGI